MSVAKPDAHARADPCSCGCCPGDRSGCRGRLRSQSQVEGAGARIQLTASSLEPVVLTRQRRQPRGHTLRAGCEGKAIARPCQCRRGARGTPPHLAGHAGGASKPGGLLVRWGRRSGTGRWPGIGPAHAGTCLRLDCWMIRLGWKQAWGLTADFACASLEPFYADWIVALPEGVESKVRAHLQRGSFLAGGPCGTPRRRRCRKNGGAVPSSGSAG